MLNRTIFQKFSKNSKKYLKFIKLKFKQALFKHYFPDWLPTTAVPIKKTPNHEATQPAICR